MRISKLFHWLYASIMLMPIFAIGVKSLYVTFNPNSKDSYYGETINESDTLNVQFSNLKVNDNVTINTYNLNSVITTTRQNLYIKLKVSYISSNPTEIIIGNDYVLGFNKNVNNNYTTFVISEDVNTTVVYAFSDNITIKGQILNLYSYYGLIDTNNLFANNFYQIIEYNDYSYIDNVFYYSVEQISNESLFNWANGTFLAQPLLFITNLFGVPSTSPIITILCYWFAISVIWLVFDVIMYIPLLVHRWLDKGVIE